MSDIPTALDSDFASLKHRSMHGAAATAGAQVIRFALQFISQIWLARLILPADYGLVAMVAPILSFIAVISDMGLGTALIQQRSISQSQVSGLFWLNSAISMLLSVMLVALAPAIGLLYHEPKTIPITITLACLFFVASFAIYPSALLAREMRFVVRAVIDTIQLSIGLIVGILAARAGFGYWALLDQQAASTASGLIMVWYVARWMPSPPRWDPSVVKLLRFGTSLTLSNVATYLSTTADNILVGAVNGKVALGLYDKAFRLVLQPLNQISAPIGRIAIPLLSRLQDDPQRYRSSFCRMIQLPLLFSFPGLICGIFLAPQLISIFLGPKWMALTPVLVWICVGGLTSFLYGSGFWLFSSQGRGRDQMRWSIITSGINVLSFAIGIRWGAPGVAFCSALSFISLQTPLMLWGACKTGPVQLREIVQSTAPLFTALIVTAPTIYLFAHFVQLSAIGDLAVGSILCVSVYIFVLCLSKSGRDILTGGLNLARSYVGKSLQRA